MTEAENIVKKIAAALEHETRINIHSRPLKIEFADGVATLEGEVPTIAGKKLALERAGAVNGVTGIVDRLTVGVGERLEDGALRDQVCKALLQEQPLEPYQIRALVKGGWETVRRPPGEPFGTIDVEVSDGIVTLNGQVGSWVQKRLAGVMAWWARGVRDVVNGLEVVPAEEDNDDEVVDAVRLVLEEDPFVNASQVRVGCDDYVISLQGLVTNDTERKMAELDAWYVFRVKDVVNSLEVME